MTAARDFVSDPIRREDIEAKVRELQRSVEQTGEAAKSYALAIGVVVGLVILALVFLIGRRRGRASDTVVEIRRI